MKILSHLTNHPSQNTPNYTLDGTTASKILQIPSLFSLTCSLIVLLFNVWTLFSTIFWICVDYNPGNPILFVEVLIESVLLFEILTRFLLKIFLEKGYDNLNLYHSSNKDRIWVLIVIIVGSCPIHIIYAGLENSGYPQEDFSFLSRMLAIKFLRSFEIRRTFKKIEEILFYKKFRILVLVKYVMNSIIVLLITHIATCSWLLLQSYSTGEPVIHGQNPDNPFAESVLYFERMNMSDASILIKYTYATDWAVGALTGCNFADVTPQTLQEVILTIIIFLMGILLLAKIFSDFASLFYLLDTENSQAKAKSVQALKLCQILNIPPDIKYKVQRYYALDNQAFSQTQHFSEIKKLPSTLEADVMLALNKGLIIKTNLFNSAPPAFVLMMVRYLYPQVSMAGDYIIRIGEYANEMYFIKQGEVEILATDNKTRIAILREGAYFGEIGILLSQKRTVNVRALTFCHFEAIDKKDFLMILDGFPQQRELLLNVANQRKQTTMPQDIEDSTLLGTVQVGRILLGSPRAQVSSRAGKPENLFKGSKKKGIRTPSNVFSHTLEQVTDFIGRFLFTGKGLDFRSAKVILPNSRFHKIWVIILSVATFLNQIMVPYEISFVNDSDETSPSWITIDIILVVVYFIDIIINMNTSVKIKGIYTSNRKQIQEIYLKENFVIDLLAFLPIDYILIGLSLPIDYSQWIKLLRFIKISRCITLIRGLRNNGQRKNRYFQLIFLMILHISLSHYTACIMHMIASAENRDYSGLTMIKDLDVTNIVDVPVTSQSPFIQYVYFMYWACCVSSAGAYGDISGVTPGEKWFQIITTLFFRVYFAFYAAEIAAIVSTGHTFYTENLAKKATYDQWMRHLKLPQEIVKRVQRYNDCIWQRYRGLNENQILDDLPKSTRQEILEFLLFDMLEAVEIFPNDETGLFSNIVKDFRFLIVTKDEYIFRAGEVIEEIYFILEGEVAILDDPTQNEIAHLKHNDFFGETVIVEGANSTRTESAKAKTDVSLGVLHLSSIRSLWNKYPTLKEKMIAIAHLRKGHYKKVSETNKLSHRELTLKDLDTETRPMEFKVVLKEVDDMDAPTHDFKEEPKISAQVTDTVEDTERPFLFDISNLPIISDDEHHRPHSPQFKLEDRIGEKARIETIAPKYLDASDMPHRSFSFDSKCNLDNAIETAELKSLPFVGLKPIPILPDKQDTVDVYPTSRQSERPLEDQKEEKSDKIVIKKSRFSTKMLGEKKVKFCIMMITNLAVLFEWIYRPLALALDFVDFNQGPVIAYELLLTLIFVTNFILQLKHLKVQRDRKSSRSLKRGRSLFQDEIEGSVLESDSDLVLLGSTISVIPFQLIFCNMDVQGQSTNFFLILLQLSRLSLIRKLPNILKLDFFKKRYALTKILIIVITFVLLNHLFACIFIMLANAKSDFKTTWFTKIPAPYYNAVDDSRGTFDAGQFTIYIHALYWSCVTTSHIGVGDVSAINNGERIYTIIIMIISTFLYALFFGNFASMVEDLVPKFQKDYESNYNKVQEYTKALKLDSFMNKIHAYYSYLWQSTKGINENTLLNRLPASLKVDIFLTRFEEVVSQSKFFKNEDEEVDSKILNFFCQKCQYRVFMKNEFLITTGQEVNDIYLILEGKAEIVNYNLNSNQASLLHPGDYFGGIFTNMTQIQNIMTKGITKVAVLGQKDFLQLKETFPVWYKYIIKDDKFYKIGMKFLRNVRKCIQIRTTKNQRNQLRLPTWQTSNKDFGSENDFTSNKSDDSPGRSPARSEQMNTYPDIPKENKPMQLKDTRELQITNKFTETQAIPNAIETCVSVLYSGPSMKPEQKEGSATESQNQSKPQSPSHIQNPLIKLEDIQMVESGNIGKLSDKFQSKTPSSFRSRNLRKSERSVKNRLSTWLSGISILKDIRKRFSVPYAEPKVKTPKAGAVDPEVVLAKKESSRRHRKLQSQRSSYSNAPSFLIQEEDEDVDKDKSLRQSHSNKKKKTARLTLRKHTQFMAKSLANNFFHVVTLKRSLTQDLKRLRYYIEPNSAWRTAYEMIHTLVILYSVFAVPLMVGFDIQFGLGLILSEALIGLEQIVYIVLSARTAQFVYGILTLKQSIIWGKLWERGIWLELLAIIPFNLIFGALSISSPLLLIGILRLNRVLLVFRLPSKLASISVRYPELSSLMGVLKPTLYLAFISHFIACLFRFSLLLEPKQNFQENFTDFLELSTAPIPNQYLISLTFILSIATTTGYRELQIYNNYERLIFMLCVCIGDVFSAVILGWFVAATSALGQKYLTMFQDIRKVDSVLQTDPIPKKIRKKATNYFKYIVDTQSHNKSPLEVLSDLLPQSMLKEMTFQQAKIFHHFPLFQEFKSNKPLLADIVANLKANIYLPHDYIISRNDYGTEAYLISEGLVHIFSPTSEKRIMGVLKEGNFFGELSVYTTTKRLVSFVAASFCVIQVLEKNVLKKILKSYPHAHFEFRLFAKERLDAYSKQSKNNQNRLSQNYTLLRMLSLRKTAGKNDVEEILKTCEVPLFMLKKNTSSKKKTVILNNLPLLRFASEEELAGTNINDEDLDASVEYYIDEDEMKFREFDTKKTTFRAQTTTKERRFSRVKKGREKRVAQSHGMEITYGIDIE